MLVLLRQAIAAFVGVGAAMCTTQAAFAGEWGAFPVLLVSTVACAWSFHK